jgi:PA14 domain
LLGSYYGDAQFGTLRLTRTDAVVSFNWGTSAPDAALPADTFSVRWTGQVQPRYSENYTFRVTADDGVRMWVGGAKILDAWNGAYGGVNSAALTLNANQRYDVVVEFREDRGGASIKLEWSSAHQRLEVVPQSQLTPPGALAPSASPIVVPPTATPRPATATPVPTQPPVTATLAPTQPPSSAAPKLLFGIGPEADSALQTRLAQEAPNAQVSLGWGGWQTRWDDPASGAGRSMFAYFADVLRASDFQSFQAMQSDTNIADVRAMVRTLGAYGPVMLAHYKPDNGSQTTFDQDLRTMLTDSYLAEVTQAGLFAWSFMDNKNLSASETSYQFAMAAVMRYGASAK